MRILTTIILFSSLTIPLTSSSQQINFTSPATEWQMMPASSHYAPFQESYFSRSVRSATIHFDKKGLVYPVHYGKESFGISMVDMKGNVKWEAKTKGLVIGMAKSAENIVCIYSEEWVTEYPKKPVRNLYAGLFDPKNGKLINEKKVLENNDFNIDAKVLSAPDEQLTGLLVRLVPKPGVFSRDPIEKQYKTEKISLIKLSASLESTEFVLSSVSLTGSFMGCLSYASGDFIVTTRLGDEIVIEKFSSPNYSSPQKTSFYLEMYKDMRPKAHLKYDATKPGIVYAILKYWNNNKDRVLTVCKIDINTKKAVNKTLILNKDFASSLENDPEAKKSKIGKRIDEMDIADIIIQENKITLLTQIRYAYSHTGENAAIRFRNDQIMITSFDTGLVKSKSMIVNRTYELFAARGEKLAWNVVKNNLYLIYNVLDGAGKVGAECLKVDLDKFTITSQEKIERGELKSYAVVETDAIEWLPDGVFIPYYHSNNAKNGEMVFRNITFK